MRSPKWQTRYRLSYDNDGYRVVINSLIRIRYVAPLSFMFPLCSGCQCGSGCGQDFKAEN